MRTHIMPILALFILAIVMPAYGAVPVVNGTYANEYSIGVQYVWTTDVIGDDNWVIFGTDPGLAGAIGTANTTATNRPHIVHDGLTRNTTYYYQAYSKNGSDVGNSAILSFKTSDASKGFSRHLYYLLDTQDDFTIFGSVEQIVHTYEDNMGAYLFWSVMISLFFAMYWIRQENVIAPVILGLIGGMLLMPLLPPEADVILKPLLAISAAGLLYQIIKAR